MSNRQDSSSSGYYRSDQSNQENQYDQYDHLRYDTDNQTYSSANAASTLHATSGGDNYPGHNFGDGYASDGAAQRLVAVNRVYINIESQQTILADNRGQNTQNTTGDDIYQTLHPNQGYNVERSDYMSAEYMEPDPYASNTTADQQSQSSYGHSSASYAINTTADRQTQTSQGYSSIPYASSTTAHWQFQEPTHGYLAPAQSNTYQPFN
ncbi:hypothetical protein NHQ30_002601 [Ciborinia camelliae]|nr:hypothetical protein NHQ30_002601 [Ciborinia camelliae]